MRPGKFEIITGKVVALSDSSGAGLSLGATCGDRGKDRGALQVSWPPRSALGVGLGSANAELSLLCYGHGRCYKPSLTVEEVRGRGEWGRGCPLAPVSPVDSGFSIVAFVWPLAVTANRHRLLHRRPNQWSCVVCVTRRPSSRTTRSTTGVCWRWW